MCSLVFLQALNILMFFDDGISVSLASVGLGLSHGRNAWSMSLMQAGRLRSQQFVIVIKKAS